MVSIILSHEEAHPLAGKTVKIIAGEHEGKHYWIEDWWDKLTGGSWMFAEGNPTCLQYAMRSGFEGLPSDDEVVYGKIGALGHLVHVSELGEEV